MSVTTSTISTSPAVAPMVRSFNDRLSLPLGLRLPLSMIVGAGSGFLLGTARGSIDSGSRFQAENAHRQPSSQKGWYLYHKSKNYHMALGGIVEGFKQGFRYSLWVGLYFLLEEGVDRGRASATTTFRWLRSEISRNGPSMDMSLDEEDRIARVGISRDCLSSMLAGLGTAGLFSAWYRFPVPTAARTAKLGAKAGLAFGLLQDLLSLVRGRRVGYVDFITRHTFGSGGDLEVKPTAAA